jgi:uncharacterized protein with PIN domain
MDLSYNEKTAMKFAVDCMLGKLAKWLKILGFDAAFFSRISDRDLLDLAVRENRVLLTRDTDLIRRAGRVSHLFIASDEWKDQVIQVVGHFRLGDKFRPHTRCLECNRPLRNLSKAGAKNLVAPHVFENSENFALCSGCGRVYWRGSHFKDMDRRLRDIFEKQS